MFSGQTVLICQLPATPRENLFYFATPASFRLRIRMETHTVSPTCSRKTFFARLGGLLAATGLGSLLAAKSDRPTTSPLAAAPVNLRPETRAVPRRAGSV